MSLNNIKEKFEKNLSPEAQTNVKKYLIIGVVLIFGVIWYYSSGRSESKEAKTNVSVAEEISFDESLMESDLRESISNEMKIKAEQDDARVKNLEAQTEELTALMEALKSSPSPVVSDLESSGSVDPIGKSTPYGASKVEYPPANGYFENSPDNGNFNGSNTNAVNNGMVEEPHFVGSIGYAVGAQPLKEEEPAIKKNLIRLPPSFMKASLLVGIDAMTSQMGENNPETIILRVQAPAVLPNRVKQNLEGCFIVADAFGNLAKERVQVRLVSLHCNSTDGKAVIDQKIKGFVADTDGKRDLAGIVVSKAGANMARLAISSVFGSAGSSLGNIGSSVVSTSSSTTTTVDPSNVLLGAAAQGLGAGANEVSTIYSDLVKQSTPTIEVGASKKLTVIIQEKVDLEIKTYE